MKFFKDKVAVVTGAASGIGRALAENFISKKMKVVLADIEEESLLIAAEEMASKGGEVLAVQTDVSTYEDMVNLAQKTLDSFGTVHILCNNAGVIDMVDRPVWETPVDSMTWLMGVNIWGIVYGIHVFVPIMLRQGLECHIVNTASIAGLLSDGHYGLYNASKHAVVSLSETIHLALLEQEANIKVSVLCPGFVNTKLIYADRNLPSKIGNDTIDAQQRKKENINQMSKILKEGMSPDMVAEYVLQAIIEGRFYILPHKEFKPSIKGRMVNILEELNPKG